MKNVTVKSVGNLHFLYRRGVKIPKLSFLRRDLADARARTLNEQFSKAISQRVAA